jgi:hypothetical protein
MILPLITLRVFVRYVSVAALVAAMAFTCSVRAQEIVPMPTSGMPPVPEAAGPLEGRQSDPFATWNPAADTQYTATGVPKLSTPYPNPATGEVRIDYSAGRQEYGVALLRVYDFLGKEIKTLSLKKGSGSIMLDINNLQPGIYFYSLEIDKKIVSTKRLVVTR